MARNRDLLKDKAVKAWYGNVAAGAKITADVYLRTLALYCRLTNETPAKLLTKPPMEVRNEYAALIRRFESEGKAQSYMPRFKKALASFLIYNGVEHKLNGIKIGGIIGTPTLANERVPTQEELRRIFVAANRKARIACALMAFSGVRPEVFGNYTKTDGLIVGDLPEMKVSNGIVTFDKIPTMVTVRLNLNKARKPYFTFLGDEGCFYLKQWLEERMNKGEVLTPSSPIIAPRLLTAKSIRDDMRAALRSAGFPWRPYVLRSYFDTQLLLAESKGLVARDYRTFWMGHIGDIENRYTTNRAHLPAEMIEDMRASYQKALKFLETNVKEERNVANETRRQLLAIAGFKEEEIEKMGDLSDEKVREAVKDRLLGGSGQHRQVVVGNGEVPKLLGSGYEFVSPLGNSQAVLREP